MEICYDVAYKKYYTDIYDKKVQPEKQFLKNLPDWPAFERIANSTLSKILWVLTYTAFYFFFADSAWWFLLLPVTITMGPVHGVIINWFAHKYGYIKFKQKNTSHNLFPVDLIMLGEGYHNDHHQHLSNANFGVRWFEIGFIYYVILLFNKMHIVRLMPKHYLAEHN